MFHLNGNYKINQFTYVSHQIKLLQTTYLYIIYSPVYSITDTTKHEDSKSEAQIKHHGFHQVQCTNLDQTLNETDNVAQDDTPLMKDGSRLFPKVVHSLPASQLHQRAPHKPH